MPDVMPPPVAPSPNATPPPAPVAPPAPAGFKGTNIGEMFDHHFGDAPPAKIDPPAAPDPATPAAGDAPPKPTAPPKTEDKLASMGLDDQPITPSKPAAPPAKDDVPPGPKQLRDAYNKLKGETDRLEAELAKAKTPTNQKEIEAERAKIKAIEDRNAELQRRVEELDYFKSDDYIEKYQKPRTEALQSAVARIATFKVDNGDGTQRQATPEDFYKLVRATDGEADEMAEKFGKSAPRVIQMRESILEKIRQEESAVANASKTIEARKVQQAEQQQTLHKELAETFMTRFDQRLESLSASPLEGWEAPQDVRDQGRMLATVAFSNPDGLEPKQLAAVQSEVAARAGAWKSTAMLAQHLMSENEALRAKLAGYEGSAPKSGQPPSTNGVRSSSKTVAEEFDSFMQQGR